MTIRTAQAKIIKTFLVSGAIFVESFFLTQSFIHYFATQGYFSLNFSLLSGIGGLVLLLCYTVSLSSPAWGEWSQFVIAPAPFALGVFFNLLRLEPANALVISALLFLMFSYFVERSINLEQVLAKNIPGVFLRPAIKGLLLVISGVAAGTVLLTPTAGASLSEKLSQATSRQVEAYLGTEFSLPGIGLNAQTMGSQITEQIKDALEPYRHLINILTAFFIFITMQGFNTLVYLVFSLTIGFIFWTARKTGFIHKETQLIEKETLRF